MLVIRRPGEFQTGSIESKSNGDDEATATWQTLPYDFAIGVHEVTMEQFRRFRPDANFALDVADNPQCPANKVSFNDAIKYCEWLNDQEGIPAEERCYDPDAATEQGLQRFRWKNSCELVIACPPKWSGNLPAGLNPPHRGYVGPIASI